MFYSYDAFSYVSVMYITVHEALLRCELSTSINCFSFASTLHTQAAFLKKTVHRHECRREEEISHYRVCCFIAFDHGCSNPVCVLHTVSKSEEVGHFPFSFECGLECVCHEFWASSAGSWESSGATCCSGLLCYTYRHLLFSTVIEKGTRGAGSLPLLAWLLLRFCDSKPILVHAVNLLDTVFALSSHSFHRSHSQD